MMLVSITPACYASQEGNCLIYNVIIGNNVAFSHDKYYLEVILYMGVDLTTFNSQHWFRQWLVAWRNKPLPEPLWTVGLHLPVKIRLDYIDISIYNTYFVTSTKQLHNAFIICETFTQCIFQDGWNESVEYTLLAPVLLITWGIYCQFTRQLWITSCHRNTIGYTGSPFIKRKDVASIPQIWLWCTPSIGTIAPL